VGEGKADRRKEKDTELKVKYIKWRERNSEKMGKG